MRARVAFVVSVLTLAIACGTSTLTSPPDPTSDASVSDSSVPVDASPPPDSATDAGQADARADARDDAGAIDGGRCVSAPVQGAPCSASDVACNAVDRCCYDSTWSCNPTTSTWTKTPHGMLCLLCQATPCGPKTCLGGQLCVERQSGVPGGQTTYTCEDYPAACAADWTCGCVAPTVASCMLAPSVDGGAGCVESPRHHVHVTCMGQ